jgi:hypothetical protein
LLRANPHFVIAAKFAIIGIAAQKTLERAENFFDLDHGVRVQIPQPFIAAEPAQICFA